MATELVTRPFTPGKTAIRQELLDHFASRGARLSWQQYTPENVSSLYGDGFVPVNIADFDESSDENVKALAELARNSHFVTPEGYIQKRDCILMRQSVEAWEANQELTEARRRAREDGFAATEQLRGEIERDLAEAGGRGAFTGAFRDARDLVQRARGTE